MSKDALYFLQQCLNAVQVSSFYGLLAVAYPLVYGITNRINLAFGAMAMWAGYLVIGSTFLLMAVSPFKVVLIIPLAIAHALIGTSLLGFAIQRLVIRPLVHRTSLAMLIATIGLAIVLEEIVRITHNSRELWLQPILDDRLLIAQGDGFTVEITTMRLLIVAASLILSIGLILFISRHRFGRLWRACSQDLGMAALCGVNVGTTLALTFVISGAYAAASGAVIALYYGNASFYMGTVLGLKALVAAVIGGLHSVPGAFFGAFILGFLESFWSAYFAADYRDVVVFATLILCLIFRPQGMISRAPTTV